MGDQLVQDDLRYLTSVGTAPLIIRNHSEFLGRTAVVRAWFPEFRDRSFSVECNIGPGDAIELASEPGDEAFLEYAAEKFASALGYRFRLCREQEGV